MAELRRESDGGTMTAEHVPVATGRDPDEANEVKDPKTDRPPRDIKEVRASDIEPYTGLGYLSKLFRFMAVILILLLIAEVVTGVYTQGSAAVPTLLGEASRLIVLAGVLWGTGDLANLLIDVGHDVRAARILVARVAHAAKVAPLSIPRTAAERNLMERISETRSEVPISELPGAGRRNLADHSTPGDDGPPIP